MDNVLSKEIKPNSNIAIYGFGPYGESYFLDLFSKYKITALYDRTYCLNKRIINSPEKINSEKFDYIIVTVMNEKARNGVLDFLNKKNISEEKIICVNYV
ncbi:hypothetical protein [Succinivibrio dextrinosolvens]|uniref:hypothetical protein n=1 Tax=Succinivibrio dextrinosolvens TaxID=83771 RepID=UPI0011607E76|nr:hypothetical protein [Succinivibrio dextrinosolvens]